MDILGVMPSTVSVVEYATEEEWLEERKKGIGGSDIAVLLGLNKYKSKLQLYKEKVENYKKDMSDNVFIKKGKDLEDFIRIKYVTPYFNEKEYNVIHPDTILKNSKYPNLRVSLDGLAIPKDNPGDPAKNVIIEIKWVSEYAEDNWNTEEYFGIPANYYAQVQEYMLVTGAKKAVVCALFDSSWQVNFYEIPINYDFCAKIVNEADEFMRINVGMRIPPSINSALDKDFLVEALSKQSDTIVEDEQMDELIVGYREVKNSIKMLENLTQETMSKLTQLYLDGHRPKSPLCKMTISAVQSTRFDADSFKKDYPDLYKEYTKTSSYSRTTIK